MLYAEPQWPAVDCGRLLGACNWNNAMRGLCHSHHAPHYSLLQRPDYADIAIVIQQRFNGDYSATHAALFNARIWDAVNDHVV